MRKITLCENLGERKVPGAAHDYKYSAYRMSPGTAWKLDDESRDHTVVEVDDDLAKKAKHTWRSRWVDGRTVIIFEMDGVEYAQPVIEDPRARDVALGSTRKRRTKHKAIRKQAPGVAPEAVGEPEPERKRRGRAIKDLAEPGAVKRRARSGPRGGLSLL